VRRADELEGRAYDLMSKAYKLLAEAARVRAEASPETSTPAAEWIGPEASPLGRRPTLALCRSGALESAKIGRRVLVRRASLEAYVERHRRGDVPAYTEDEDLFGAGSSR
jgi:hypothetical protein